MATRQYQSEGGIVNETGSNEYPSEEGIINETVVAVSTAGSSLTLLKVGS